MIFSLYLSKIIYYRPVYMLYGIRGRMVISAHFKVGPLQARPIETISLIKVVGLNKV